MYKNITENEFFDGLKKSFSYEACKVLFEFFEEYEEEIGKKIEYDPIAIRCEWTEISIHDAYKEYDVADLTELKKKYMVLSIDGTEGILIKE